MTDIEVIITQPVIEVKFESTLNTGGGGAVDSVNGQTGDVVLTTTDINEGTNQYFTDARAIAALATTLLSYVTTTALNTALSAYVTAVSLASTLANYVTNSSLATTLSNYVTNSSLASTLASYVTSSSLTTTLANYVTLGTEQTISALKTFSNGFTLTPQATPTYARGRVYFDDANDCLAFMDSISGRSVQVGYEVLMLARNNTGVQINNGQVVYISGSTGTNSTVALARADSESTSMIIGVATHNIAINTVGKIVVFGLANDLDTSAFTDGQEVFLSAATAGAITTTPPASPNFVVRIGIVERAHPTQGKILVKPEITTANNNSLGTSQRLAPTQNSVKTYVDNQIGKEKTLDFFVGTSTTTNNAETILRTIPIAANDVSYLDLVWIRTQISTTQTSGNITTRIRVGTSAVPSNITLETELINGGVTASAGGAYSPINQYITFESGNIISVLRAFMGASAAVQMFSSVSPPLNATWYIYITTTKAAAGTISLTSSIIKRDRA